MVADCVNSVLEAVDAFILKRISEVGRIEHGSFLAYQPLAIHIFHV
jgi:hypothetical protein